MFVKLEAFRNVRRSQWFWRTYHRADGADVRHSIWVVLGRIDLMATVGWIRKKRARS